MASRPRTSGSSSRPISPHTRAEANQSTPPTDVFATPSVHNINQPSPPRTKFPPLKRAASTPPETTNKNIVPRSPRRVGGDPSSISNLQQSWSRQQLSKKRSQYYEGAFAYREASNTARARITKDSLVTAEVKLNCKLENEQPFLADLSFQLSEIYQRPASSIMVMLAPETPMLIGGNVEPAYHITITALSLEIAPTKNKRSTALIHSFILESLDIPLESGVIRFEAVAEENLAVNGKTILQEVEETEKNPNEEDGVLCTISRNRGRMGRKSSVPIFTQRGRTPTFSSTPAIPSRLKLASAETKDPNYTFPNGTMSSKKSKYRKSIMKALFGPQG